MTTSGIYCIRNTKNGKTYVGSSVDVPRRLAEHRSFLSCGTHPNPHLQRAWNHYGENAFSFALLEELSRRKGETDKQFNRRLAKREQFHMDALDSMWRGYNHRGAERLDELTDEARARSLAACRTPEFRERLRQANLGRKFTPEHLAHLRKVYRTPEYRAKIRTARLKMTDAQVIAWLRKLTKSALRKSLWQLWHRFRSEGLVRNYFSFRDLRVQEIARREAEAKAK